MATSSNRHPIVLLGAAASLITVLSFFGVRSWPGSEPPTPVASTQAVTPAAVITQSSAPAPAPAPSTTCSCPTRTPVPTPPPVRVSCVIEDRLGEGQVAEAVTLRFGTKEWQLNIDESDPTDRLTLRFPHAGSYRYTVETVTETADGATVHGAGEGAIACRGGQTFQLAGDYGSGQLITVTLQEA